jgi:hypothetical protein
MTNQPVPNLRSESADHFTTLMKGGLGAIPLIGPLMAEIVGNVIPNQRMDRLVQFVQILEQRLSGLEEAVLREKLASATAIDLLEDSFLLAVRATSEERLEHISNVLANGLVPEESNHSESKRMLWLLGQLNDQEIVILRGRLPMTREEFAADAEFQKLHVELLSPDASHLGSSEDELENAALKASYRQHLCDLGLIRPRFSKPRRGEIPELDGNTGMLKASGTDTTRLGKMFLRYLNLIPNWYRG